MANDAIALSKLTGGKISIGGDTEKEALAAAKRLEPKVNAEHATDLSTSKPEGWPDKAAKLGDEKIPEKFPTVPLLKPWKGWSGLSKLGKVGRLAGVGGTLAAGGIGAYNAYKDYQAGEKGMAGADLVEGAIGMTGVGAAVEAGFIPWKMGITKLNDYSLAENYGGNGGDDVGNKRAELMYATSQKIHNDPAYANLTDEERKIWMKRQEGATLNADEKSKLSAAQQEVADTKAGKSQRVMRKTLGLQPGQPLPPGMDSEKSATTYASRQAQSRGETPEGTLDFNTAAGRATTLSNRIKEIGEDVVGGRDMRSIKGEDRKLIEDVYRMMNPKAKGSPSGADLKDFLSGDQSGIQHTLSNYFKDKLHMPSSSTEVATPTSNKSPGTIMGFTEKDVADFAKATNKTVENVRAILKMQGDAANTIDTLVNTTKQLNKQVNGLKSSNVNS